MKQLKGFLFVIIGLFAMITLLSLLMPSKVMTVRSVVVHAADSIIISQITDLQNWEHWHPLFMNGNKPTMSHPSAGINAFATWNSNEKQNRLLITETGANHVKLVLARAGENDVTNIISTNPVSDSSAVQLEWRVLTKLKWYPWEKFYGIFIDKLSGPGYEQALNNLKNFVEKK